MENGMTNEQFKAYVQGLLDDLKEFQEMRKSPEESLQQFAEKKIVKIMDRLQEALER